MPCRSRIMSTTLAVSLALAATPAAPDVIGDMRDFWDRAGGGANATRPQAIIGQRAGYATLGSLYVRSTARTTSIVNLQLPSLNAGCGGIDVFTGAFSFLSAEELIAMSKAIAANATGFAFQLALESLAPTVANTMAELRDLANKVNATNIGSCESAAGLVGGLWPQMEGASELICKTIGSSQGLFQDWAKGEHDCSTGNKEADTIARGDPEFREEIPYDVNYGWKAARRNIFLSANSSLSEFFMSMTGTVIVKKTGDDDKIVRIVKTPLAYDAQTLRALVEGGTIRVYKCDEPTNCLSVTNGSTTIARGNAFFAYVVKIIDDMSDAIRDEASLPPEATALLNLTSLPIHKALVVAQAYQHHFAKDEVYAMAEAVAVDVAYRYVAETAEAVTEGAGNLSMAGDDLETFQDNLKRNLESLSLLRREGRDSFNAALAGLERLQIIETALAANGGQIFVSQLRAPE